MNEHLQDWEQGRHTLKARAGYLFFDVALKCQPEAQRFKWLDEQWSGDQSPKGR